MKRVIVGITGASGSCYAARLLECLLDEGREVHLVISEAGCQVVNEELGWETGGGRDADRAFFGSLYPGKPLVWHHNGQLGAPVASGSFPAEAMVVVPASMGAVSALATGRSANLLERAADVMLKEKKKLLVVPRESPLSEIHLENLLRLSRAGAHVIPAMPAFYHRPRAVSDLVDFVVARILDHLGLETDLVARWKGWE